MTQQQAAEILRWHNRYRREGVAQQYTAQQIGEAIDVAIEALEPKVMPTLDSITQAVCLTTGLTVAEVMLPCRHREYTEARWMIWWIARKFIGCSTTTLARYFKRKSHATIVSGLKKADMFMEDPRLNEPWVRNVNAIINRLERL